MKANNTMMKVVAAAITLCVGGMVASCASLSEKDSAAGGCAGMDLAPESLVGKTLTFDHSQAQVAQIGVAAMEPGIEKKVFTPEWQIECGWISAENQSGAQWNNSITFTSDTMVRQVNGGQESYTYKKVSETEAILTGLHEYSEEEFYGCDMRLKFITPTVAELQYYAYSVDDISYVFRHVRVTIK